MYQRGICSRCPKLCLLRKVGVGGGWAALGGRWVVGGIVPLLVTLVSCWAAGLLGCLCCWAAGLLGLLHARALLRHVHSHARAHERPLGCLGCCTRERVAAFTSVASLKSAVAAP